MKPITFSLVTATMSIFYSLGCFFYFNQPFWGFTTLFLGGLVSLYPIYFERQRSKAIMDAQIAQYFQESLPDVQNTIYKQRLQRIKDDLKAIESGFLNLSAQELGEYSEIRMLERTKKRSSPMYWATHIVDSELTLRIWNENYSTYPWLRSYVDKQKALLNMGGQVARIFFFERQFLRHKLEDCKSAIRNHELLFEGTQVSVTTLAAVIRPDSEFLESDFSILDESEVFLWKRAQGAEVGKFLGGLCLTNKKQVEAYINKWHRMRENAYRPQELFTLLENNSGILEQ